MISEADLNVIVANVLSENRYSNCRLCLADIKDEYFRFEDNVNGSVDECETSRPLSEVLSTFLGAEICDTIPGVEAICTRCTENVLETYRFIEKCNKSTALLEKIFNNLSEALNTEIDPANENQKMYIIVNEEKSKVVLSDSTVTEELKKRETKKRRYVCEECKENFETFSSFKNHNTTCHELFTCEKCLLTFQNQKELILHKETGHKFKCPLCDQCKNTEETLKDHIDKVHTVYMCKDCGKSCQGLDKLHSHESKHNAIKNECPKCGKTYITKDFFFKHVQLCLEDRLDPHPYRAKINKSYFCDKCGKGYSTAGGLRVHNKFAHGNGKHHICEHCGKKFTAPSYLKIHMVKHTGEKKFTCNICGNNLVSKEALLYHTRRHTGERPYSCKLCPEKFVNSSARAEHIKYKHASPMLTCDICHKKCYTATFLRQHRSRHEDPASKLYIGRNMIPPNMPGQQNMRVKFQGENEIEMTWSEINE